MNNAGARAEGDRGLAKPTLQRCAGGLILNYARGEWLGSEWKIVADTHRAADKFDITCQRARSDVERVINEETARVNIWTLAQIKCVGESDGVYLIVAWAKKKTRPDFRVGDLHMTHRKDESDLIGF